MPPDVDEQRDAEHLLHVKVHRTTPTIPTARPKYPPDTSPPQEPIGVSNAPTTSAASAPCLDSEHLLQRPSKDPPRTRTRHPPASNSAPPRSCIRGKQQSRGDYRAPCNSALAWRARPSSDALLLSPEGSRVEAEPDHAPDCSHGRIAAVARREGREHAGCSFPTDAGARPVRSSRSLRTRGRRQRRCWPCACFRRERACLSVDLDGPRVCSKVSGGCRSRRG